MRRNINNLISTIVTLIKLCILKLLHGKDLKFTAVERFSPNVVVEINKGGMLHLGKKVRAHSGCKFRVRTGATLTIGSNVRINYNCMIFCHDSISIGDGCEVGPNVLVYDHDHDFKCEEGIKSGKYLCARVRIGENVWIGANTVILRGATIGDNAVIGAGSIVKGEVPAGAVYVQKRGGQTVGGGTMIRVLHMIGSLNVGGSQAMVMNLYRNIDRSRIQFDFISDHPGQVFFADEIRKLGGIIYEMPTFRGTNIIQVRQAWDKFFTEHSEYGILHSHVRSYASVYLPIAKAHGVKTIIHSHSTSNGSGALALVKRILQFPLRYQADYFFSCSQIAGEWLFGRRITESDRYYMLQNAIRLKDYKMDNAVRSAVRREIKAENKKVFGHVGRLYESKNHEYLMEVFKGIHSAMPDSVLMIVGDGALRPQIEGKIRELGLQDSVILMGMRSDVSHMLMAMDCFLFPSKWEGLPVTVVEAQAAGLPCFVSDTVTKDVGISELVTYLPIDEGAEVWSNAVLSSDLSRKDVSKEIIKAGFDIGTSVAWLSEFYERIWPGSQQED